MLDLELRELELANELRREKGLGKMTNNYGLDKKRNLTEPVIR